MSEGHSHTLESFEKFIKLGIILNITFVVIELIAGFISGSIALVADAGHNFSDVLSLLLAWLASWLIRQNSSRRYSYGYKKGSIHVAIVNSMLLLIALGAITWEAIKRLTETTAVQSEIMIYVSGIGIIINGLTAFMFMKGRKGDLNVKSVFFHMLTDTLVSLGVLISGVIILYTDMFWLDPVISLIIVGMILYGSLNIFRESVKMSMDAVPANIEIDKVRDYLTGLAGVQGIHDLHVWSISTSHTALTAHLVMDVIPEQNNFLNNVAHELNEKFRIEHCTLQIESCDSPETCRLGNCIQH